MAIDIEELRREKERLDKERQDIERKLVEAERVEKEAEAASPSPRCTTSLPASTT